MPPDRLAALRRQRQLIQDHLAWLDTEIAAASDPAKPDAAPVVAPVTPPPPTLPASPAATPTVSPAPDVAPAPESSGKLIEADPEALARANALADSLIQQYKTQNTDTPDNARRSCLLLAIAFGLFCTAAVMGIYLFYYR